MALLPPQDIESRVMVLQLLLYHVHPDVRHSMVELSSMLVRWLQQFLYAQQPKGEHRDGRSVGDGGGQEGVVLLGEERAGQDRVSGFDCERSNVLFMSPFLLCLPRPLCCPPGPWEVLLLQLLLQLLLEMPPLDIFLLKRSNVGKEIKVCVCVCVS